MPPRPAKVGGRAGPAGRDEPLPKGGVGGGGAAVPPPSWRRDVEGKADLVEEVARIEGFDALPSTPLPPISRPAGGALTVRQTRMRNARRALARRAFTDDVKRMLE